MIPTCVECLGTSLDRDGKLCWCSRFVPESGAAVHTAGFHWLNETPPGKITEIVVAFMERRPLDQDGLDLVRWYIGQWCQGLIERGRKWGITRSLKPLAGWERKLAEGTTDDEIRRTVRWLQARGVDPFL